MCQARRDGGRRCPIHRHDSIAVMNRAHMSTDLTKEQMEHTFRELMREGRGAAEPTQEQWDNLKQSLKDNLVEGKKDTVTPNLVKAEAHSGLPDGKTFYALSNLATKAERKDATFKALIEEVAQHKGYTVEAVKEHFDKVYEESKRSYGQGRPEGYTQSGYQWAIAKGLPYDTQSVTAYNAINSLESNASDTPRVERIAVDSTSISEIGYNADGGRLEVKSATRGIVRAYRNVPQEVYEQMVEGGKATAKIESVFAQVAANTDYLYEDGAQADLDKYAVKCATCGQFSSPVSHTCPANVSTENVDESFSVPGYNPAAPTTMWHKEGLDNVDMGLSVIEEVSNEIDITRYVDQGYTFENPYFSSEKFTMREQYQIPQMKSQIFARSQDYENFDEFASQIEEILDKGQAINIVTVKVYKNSQDSNYPESASLIVKVESKPNFGNAARSLNVIHYGFPENGIGHKRVLNPNVKIYEIKPDFSEDDYSNESIRIDNSDERKLPMRATASRNIILDAQNNDHAVKSFVRIPKVNDIKKAMRETNRFHMEVEATAKGKWYTQSTHADDQGYLVSYRDLEVSGTIEFAKNDKGEWAAVPNMRSLRCECYDYRLNYTCHHIHMINRKANNLLAQSGALVGGSSSTRLDVSSMENGQYLTTALARRSDLTVVPPNEEQGQELTYKFSQISSSSSTKRRQKLWLARINSLSRYEEKGPDRIESFQDYKLSQQVMGNYTRSYSFATVDNPRDIEQALKKGGLVEVPVEARWGNYYYSSSNSEGTITLYSDKNGNVAVKSHTIKCDCLDYQENYDCKHVRATVNLGPHIPSIGRRDYEGDRDSGTDHNFRVSQEFRNQNPDLNDLYYEMQRLSTQRPDMDEKALRESVAQLVAERQEAQRIAALERAEREAEQRARRLEQYRAEAESDRNIIASYKKLNPEYAASLEAHRANLMKKWNHPESSYVEDKKLIDQAITEALERKKKGLGAVPFRESGGVLDGASDGPAGRKFGVELEFEIKSSVNRAKALEAIGKDLYDAGLTTSKNQVQYHSAASTGYSAWSFEQDCTVHGELVSPILDDSPESWRQLKLATEIITKHGGIATTKAGSHVHVSSGSYENNIAKTAELLRLSKEHEDLTYRLASNPQRGKHRGTSYCTPNTKDSSPEIASDLSIARQQSQEYLGGYHGHGNALNIGGMSHTLKKSHVEFRTWDATLDPGVIQAQVMMSVAMVDKAEYNVLKNGTSLPRPDDKDKVVGKNKLNGVPDKETHNEGGIAEYLDTFFRRDVDKDHIASLFAVTKWQSA